MKYFPKIIGERLYLSPINPENLECYVKWLNDPDVAKNLGLYSQMLSLTNEKKTLEKMSDEGHNYAIILKENDELLGNISLMEIDGVHRHATLGLFIGEAERRGKGYGTEAIRLILGYGFDTLNLHNIMLNVNSSNAQGIACYKKVGFKEIGRRREARFVDGRFFDNVFMDILATEFRADLPEKN
ncbi:MAG: GNAT family N-acetyltransferase [Treponema sp.]|nr:GNAT family N-acetyltransferase [Treponema sp.]